MADISQYLQAILEAVYGEQVRGSIHDAIDIINQASEVSISAGTAVSEPSSSSTQFFVGSMYINTTTYDLWKCVGTDSWQRLGNIRGIGIASLEKTSTVGNVDYYTITFDDGETETFTVTNGINGTNGSIWYKGTALTGTGTSITGFPGVRNDFYLNSSTGYVYVCTKTGGAMVPDAAEWDYVMTLTGGGGGSTIIVIDNLTSASSTDALSANQGRVLKNLVDQKVDSGSLAQVATSGSYSDLTNQPTIPTVDQTYSATSSNAQSGTAVAEALQPLSSLIRRTPQDITSRIQSDSGASLLNAIAEQDLAKYGYSIGDYFESPTNRSLVTQTYSGGTVSSQTVSVRLKYYIAGMDTWFGGYDSYEVVGTHHVSILVDSMVDRQWHSAADITSVGYNLSALYNYTKGDILNAIKADMKALFGGSTGLEHLIQHQLYLTKAFAACEWTQTYIHTPSEVEIYGSNIFSGNDYQKYAFNKKLAIFDKYRFNQIYGNHPIWLCNMYSAAYACFAASRGIASFNSPVTTYRASGLILLH
ncbi:MAG: hypothetical protein IKO15_03330 [Clostridiales bacterium]|nr:hypothetical protein [Clostridiales bacterium]